MAISAENICICFVWSPSPCYIHFRLAKSYNNLLHYGQLYVVLK